MSPTAAMDVSLRVDLTRWPGCVLRVARGGEVTSSNGRLEARLGVEVVGRDVASLLDHESSAAKWERMVRADDPARETWELIFCREDRVLEPAAFSAMQDGDNGWWLVEHPATPQLMQLTREAADINGELTTAQRSLVIERGRLARALQELERSNRALDEFAHAISHDLKAPLRAIRDYAELLGDPSMEQTAEERDGWLRRIHDLTGRMRQMIDAALDYARAGLSSGRIERIDTAALMREIVGYLAPPVDVVIEIAPDLPTVDAERTPFEQVFRNLLSNAIAYRRASGARIHVSGHRTNDGVELVVSDNGPGVPESQRDRVWRLFHTSRPGEGTGLGLALVKRIVESARGSVTLETSDEGGAVFRVRWPNAMTDPRHRASSADAAAP